MWLSEVLTSVSPLFSKVHEETNLPIATGGCDIPVVLVKIIKLKADARESKTQLYSYTRCVSESDNSATLFFSGSATLGRMLLSPLSANFTDAPCILYI